MRTHSLEDLWEELEPSLVPQRASKAEAARIRLAFFGGAVALLGILTKASISGEAAMIDALGAVKAELRSEARSQRSASPLASGKLHRSDTDN